MKDVRGETLKVGDEVYIYWGENQLRPGKVEQVKHQKAKVRVDSWSDHPNPELRFVLSKWKGGQCMVKAPGPTGYYPDEVILLLEKIREWRDAAPNNQDGLPIRQLCQGLLNYWDMKRPMNLVCS